MAREEPNSSHQTRSPPPGATEPPEHVKKPQIYEIFHSSKPEDRDGGVSMEGAPSHPDRPTISDAAKSIKPEDFLKVHRQPCAKQGFMTGIGAGAVVGFGRYIWGGRIPRAANWAAGAFLLGSIVQYEVCQYSRIQERAQMARVVEVIDQKQAEKKARAEEARRIRTEAQEKRKQAEAAQSRWYKFW